jgi:hypothetical protein
MAVFLEQPAIGAKTDDIIENAEVGSKALPS